MKIKHVAILTITASMLASTLTYIVMQNIISDREREYEAISQVSFTPYWKCKCPELKEISRPAEKERPTTPRPEAEQPEAIQPSSGTNIGEQSHENTKPGGVETVAVSSDKAPTPDILDAIYRQDQLNRTFYDN